MAADYDVAIIGGSLAGCTAATLFAKAGRSVALVESHPDINAYKKLCTTQILACAAPTIERFGLDGLIADAGGVRTLASLWTRWGWIHEPTAGGDEARFFSIRREKLEPMVRQIAAGTPGVELLLGHRARRLIRERGDDGRVVGVSVEDREGGIREVRARLVVGADGRHSSIAEMAGVGAARWKQHKRFAYYAHFRNVSLPAGRRLHWWHLDPEIAYGFPMDDNITLLAYAAPKETKLQSFKQDIEGSLIRALRGLPDPPRFTPADRVSKVMGVIDYPTVWRLRPPPGLAFVGDAAVTADWVWGVGCAWAFQSSAWLADAAAASLDTDKALDAAVRRYRGRVRSELLAHFLLICDYQSARRMNPIEQLMFSAAAKDPSCARTLTEFGQRRIPVRTFLSPTSVGHAVRVTLTRRGPNHVAGPVPPERDADMRPHTHLHPVTAVEPAPPTPHASPESPNGRGIVYAGSRRIG